VSLRETNIFLTLQFIIMKKIIFFALLLSAYFSFYAFQCSSESVGNGNRIKKELTGLTDFNSVANGIAADIELIKGDTYKVVYEGDENLLDDIRIEVKGKSLNFENKKTYSYMSSRSKIRFTVTMPELQDVALGGSGSIVTKSDFNSEKISIALGGSGDIRLTGSAKYQEVAIGGSGDVDLSNLTGEKAEVSIGGSGNVKVNVSERLEVAIAGSGDVEYQGDPSIKETVVGSGEVKKRR
jgi:hypothetical protein